MSDLPLSHPISDLDELLRSLEPRLNPGTYAFCSLAGEASTSRVVALEPLATFREAEGLTVILEEASARRAGLQILFVAAWITLDVNSDLHAVGLTPAVSGALARGGISCNVVAAAAHDHLFVPADRAEEALVLLRTLQGGQPRR